MQSMIVEGVVCPMPASMMISMSGYISAMSSGSVMYSMSLLIGALNEAVMSGDCVSSIMVAGMG